MKLNKIFSNVSGLSSSGGVQSIDSLLNNTVAPNVTLTSRSSAAPDSQLSPNFSQSLMQQQLSPSHPRGNAPFGTQSNQSETLYHISNKFISNKFFFFKDFQQNPFTVNSGVHRLSPQQQQINQQILNSFQQSNNSSSNASQLSPRQPPFTQQTVSQAPNSSTNWTQQSTTSNIRLNLQQNNPMLNAQLSVSLSVTLMQRNYLIH